jgi:hypothetical protein
MTYYTEEKKTKESDHHEKERKKTERERERERKDGMRDMSGSRGCSTRGFSTVAMQNEKLCRLVPVPFF